MNERPANTTKKRWVLALCGVGIFVLLGVVLGEFWVKVATEAVIMVLFAASFSLLYGQTGLLSFGQGAYLAVGAYGFALSMTKLELAFPLARIEAGKQAEEHQAGGRDATDQAYRPLLTRRDDGLRAH